MRWLFLFFPIRPRPRDTALGKRTVAIRSHGNSSPTVVRTGPSPLLVTAHGNYRFNARAVAGRKYHYPRCCHGVPQVAILRCEVAYSSLSLADTLHNGNVFAEGYSIFKVLELIASLASPFTYIHFKTPFGAYFLTFFQKLPYFFSITFKLRETVVWAQPSI